MSLRGKAKGRIIANELKCGDAVSLQNGYSNWTGGFLDVTGGGPSGAAYAAETAPTAARDGLSGTWKIASASGKAAGATVVSGDLVFLVNQYGATTYLDVNGGPGAGSSAEKYGVSTAAVQNREGASGEWFLFAETSSPQDGAIRAGDVVHILSNYSQANGGWLDISGGAPAGGLGLHSVFTSYYSDRDSGSGDWRFAQA
ncbi:hypothetical protein [Catenulispora sp. GP43]|uniref:hypothetical protein n=1 Tax=Catenulispora sp. GP43 TaxID=3156263 RepID=UPI003510E0FB